MAAEVTAQAIVHAKLVDSSLSECSTLHVNDLVDELMSKIINLFLEKAVKRMLLLVKMKNKVACERSQMCARAGLGVNGMIDEFIYKQQF